MWKNFPLFPERASALAWQVDGLYFLLTAVSAFFTLLIFVLIFFFAVKYRRSVHPHPVQIEGSLPLELAWTLIPLGICMIFFAWGSLIYFQEARPPKGAMEVYVVGKQWMWKFEYESGTARHQSASRAGGRRRQDGHELAGRDSQLLRAGFSHQGRRAARPLYLDLVSSDEGRHLSLVLLAILRHRSLGNDRSGNRDGAFCLSGLDEQGGGATGTLASNGQQLFPQLGCATCHRFDTQGRGPNLTGVFGKQVLLEDGRTVVADENYIRESILNPGAKIVSGFKPIMPTFQGQVSEESLMALVAYIKSLSQPASGAATNTASAVPVPSNRQ